MNDEVNAVRLTLLKLPAICDKFPQVLTHHSSLITYHLLLEKLDGSA